MQACYRPSLSCIGGLLIILCACPGLEAQESGDIDPVSTDFAIAGDVLELDDRPYLLPTSTHLLPFAPLPPSTAPPVALANVIFESSDRGVCAPDVDVVILLDSSYSVKAHNFELMKTWVKHLAEFMHLDDGNGQLAVVTYSSYQQKDDLSHQKYIRTEIELGDYTDKETFDRAVDAIKYEGYKTYTAHAIQKTVDDDFGSARSRYPDAKRLLILITDGKATDYLDLPAVIEYAHQQGVAIYAIGVGDYDYDELLLIARNHSRHVFLVETFADLESIIGASRDALTECDCNAEGSLSVQCDPCTKKCRCKRNVQGHTCDSCSPGYYGFGNPNGCLDCSCDPRGSFNSSCDTNSGQCPCLYSLIKGRTCNECKEGYSGFPECRLTEAPTTTPAPTTSPYPPVNPKWSPCVTCGGRSWPSYCRGWTCQVRWPYYQQSYSPYGCSPGNWACRLRVESQQLYSGSSRALRSEGRRYFRNTFSSYQRPSYQRPSYYRGNFHHARSRRREVYRPVARYGLYRRY